MPLNLDAGTSLGLGLLNSPFLPFTQGTLDADGNATPSPAFVLPLGVASIFAGFRFTFVAFMHDTSSNLHLIGGPATLIIQD